MRFAFLAFAVIAGLAAQATAVAQPQLGAVLLRAEHALGMIRTPQQVDRLIAVQYDGSGTMHASGQTVKVPRYRAAIRYDIPGMRVDFDRVQGTEVRRQIEVIAQGFAWNESNFPGGPATPETNPAVVRSRLLQLWMTPHGAVKAARQAEQSATLTTEGGLAVLTFRLAAPLADTTMRLGLDSADRPMQVEARTPTGVIQATYSDYRNWNENGVMIPARIVQKVGGTTMWDLRIANCRCINPYVVFPLPQNVQEAKSPAS